MRLWFFGSGAFGLPTLAALAREHDLLGIVTQPDRPAGRGRKLTPNPIAGWAEEHLPQTPLLKTEHVTRERPEVLVSSDADAWVVIAFGQKLGRSLLEDRFAINLHASLLPRWRGAAPIQASMVAGDAQTGNSVIALADQMDAGVVYGQSHRAIERTQTAGELHDALSEDGPGLVMRVLEQHAAGSLMPVEQDESLVTIAPKLSRDDARLDCSAGAEACRRMVNGLSPWPGVSVLLDGEQVKLVRADAEDLAAGEGLASGVLADPDRGVFLCGDGRGLRILELIPSGRRAMPWAEYQRGRSLQRGRMLTPLQEARG